MTTRILYTPKQVRRGLFSRRILIYAAALAGALVLILGAIYILRLPRLRINQIIFSGLETIDEEALRGRLALLLAERYALFLPASSYFLADSQTLASRLREEFPRLAAVSIAKEFPDTLRVTVAERAFWGILCNSLQNSLTPACVYIDPSGFGYEKAPEPEGLLIRTIQTDTKEIAVGGQAVEPQVMERLRFLDAKLPSVADSRIIGFEIRSRAPGEIQALAADGFKLILNREDDFANVFRVLARVLKEEIGKKRERLEYIDLRFGNKVFYRLKN